MHVKLAVPGPQALLQEPCRESPFVHAELAWVQSDSCQVHSLVQVLVFEPQLLLTEQPSVSESPG